MTKSRYPKINILIPTLNAAKVLDSCLSSIRIQNYPQQNVEIIIADGGSSDDTLKIAKKFHCRIVQNPLKTAEAGKAVALKHASGEYIALIDSDNILPDPTWLEFMVKPLVNDSSLIGSEPYAFTYRSRAGFIERYSALMGVNDPYAFYCGIYDRYNYLTNKWTGLHLNQTIYKSYIKVSLEPDTLLPTIGANGTIFRASFLKKINIGDYLFDVDIISQYLHQTKSTMFFAKVKTGIIHTYCESSVKKFIRKQQRRITDYYFYRNLRHYDWDQTNQSSALLFSLVSIFPIVPL
ncbi:MAG TPA: glycosyltransferase family 2 protein, partial [Patescibacteria group bacterium]